MRSIPTILATLSIIFASPPAQGLTRDEVMTTARSFAFHPWRSTSANTTASCDAAYKSVYVPGDYLGLPYDWGGFDHLFQFDQKILQGYGAGTEPNDGVLSCTTGLDCSGFVSRCWGTSTKYGTWTLEDISSSIAQTDLLPGDAMNDAGTHVVLFSHKLSNGDPVFIQAGMFNVHVDAFSGWSGVSGFKPIRYNSITGGTAGDPQGTTENPISITSFPYSDTRSTADSPSDVLDGCGASPTTPETGPEVIYQVTLTQPGSLTASLGGMVGADIDIHLYSSMNTSDCVARHDSVITEAVDCGTYYLVADTYGSSGGTPGQYTLTVNFTPAAGQTCGSGPPQYNYKGYIGQPCIDNGYYCNPTFGGYVCLYTSGMNSTSFCTKPCATHGDCGSDFPGGCCKDVTGKGDFFCATAPLCGGIVVPDAGIPDAPMTTGDQGQTPLTDGAPVTWRDSALEGEAGLPRRDGAGINGGEPDTGFDDDGGCGCRVTRSPAQGTGLFLGLLLLVCRRRRSPRRESSAP